MNPFYTLLEQDKPILLDGAMGTMLMAAGLPQGLAPELWNVEAPDKIRTIHRAYIRAGAQIILTNSFGGNRFRLGLHGLGERAPELNQAAARLAREEADSVSRLVVVAGSMGPTGALLQPYGTIAYEDAVRAYAEQAAALVKGGVNVLWIETMSDLQEVKAAIEGAQSVSSLPVTASLTFEKRGRTMMGVTPEQVVAELEPYNLAALGANCGRGPEEIEAVIQRMKAVAQHIPLIAKANAGAPKMVNQQVTYDATPEIMGGYAQHVCNLGAKLIGGCCGNTPEHIKAISAAIAATSKS